MPFRKYILIPIFIAFQAFTLMASRSSRGTAWSRCPR